MAMEAISTAGEHATVAAMIPNESRISKINAHLFFISDRTVYVII